MDGGDGRGDDGRAENDGRGRDDTRWTDGKRPSDGGERDDHDVASVATEGEEWRFSMDDLERTNELTPGNPDPENVLFVLLGVAFTLAVLAQFVVGLP